MSPSVAPRISGWQRRVGGRPGPYSVASASGETSNELVMVELLIDGIWQDITGYVLVRESGNISIQRGQTSEGSTPDPGRCTLQLNNRDGRFSPNNPVSPYYGKIGRNTQIRVSVPKGDDKSYRFWGEVAEWPEDWDLTDTDRWVDVTAAGILRRLRQSTTPLHSTMYRGLVSSATPTPVAYWPMEDGSASTSIASAVGGPVMAIGGSPNLASDTGFTCSDSLPVLNNGAFTGSVSTYTVTGQTQIRFLMFLPTSPADNTVLIQFSGTGSVSTWQLLYGTGDSLKLHGLNSGGSLVADSGPFSLSTITNVRLRISIELTESGSNISWNVADQSLTSAFVFSGTFTSLSVGRITSLTISPAGSLSNSVFGHLSVQTTVTSLFDLSSQFQAYVGELTSNRFIRLCTEEGVDAAMSGLGAGDAMGPQRPGEFLTLIQECFNVNDGTLFEREVSLGLGFRPRQAQYNQPPTLTLDYANAELSDIPRPMPDAKLVQNSVTATRPNGSSATVQQTTGTLSVNPPPQGVGVYADAPALNVQYDADLLQHASWRVHLGTVDEPRYPEISVNLARSETSLKRLDALNVLFGKRIAVTNMPSRLGGDLSLIVIGIQETLTIFEHRITYVCQPESPFHVFQLESATFGHLLPDGSALAADAGPADTTLSVASATNVLWTTSAGDFPFDILLSGEQITVTNITGASSPQSFTVTRSVNGISKPQPLGTAVTMNVSTGIAL